MRGAGVPTLASYAGGSGAEQVRNAYGGMAPANSKLSASENVINSERLKQGARKVALLQRDLERQMDEIKRLEADIKEYKKRNEEENEHTTGYKAYMAKREGQIQEQKNALRATITELGKPEMTSLMTQEGAQKLTLAKAKSRGYAAAEVATKQTQEKAMAKGVSNEYKQQKSWDKLGFPGGIKQATAFARGEYEKAIGGR